MRLSAKIFIGFSLVLTLFIIDFWVNSTSFDKVNKDAEFLTRSETVIRNSTRLHKTMIDMQSGFRGYLLTDQESFLQPFYNGLSEIPTILAEQRSLILDSPSQRVKLDSIVDLHRKWAEYANSIIAAKRDSLVEMGTPKYRRLFESQLKKEVGKKMNDEIAMKFRQFDYYEYQLRKERRDSLNESIATTRKASLVLAVASISIGLVCALYITRIISKRISTMVKLAEQISKGEFRTIEDNSNDELTNLSKSLNVMSSTLNKNFTELERKNKELDQFAYVVSHDLKAPLRGIDNISRWIEEDLQSELSPELRNYLEMMRGRVHRLEDLINGLLEYARIGRMKQVIEEVNVKELVQGVVELVVPGDFDVRLKGQLPVLPAEKLRLEQVFANLISNAVKHHDRNSGIITIQGEDAGDHYRFTVEDDGPGIDPEYHEKIFGIFQTLRERDAKESTGVGLAIVKKIIDEQKGMINVRSGSGKGASFEFTWPKDPAANESTIV